MSGYYHSIYYLYILLSLYIYIYIHVCVCVCVYVCVCLCELWLNYEFFTHGVATSLGEGKL